MNDRERIELSNYRIQRANDTLLEVNISARQLITEIEVLLSK
jgi:hypothetical protein